MRIYIHLDRLDLAHHPARVMGVGVYDYANKMKLIYYYLLVNCTIERSVASAFIDGVLHRETSNWNHK